MAEWDNGRLAVIRSRCQVLAIRWLKPRLQAPTPPPDSACLARMEEALKRMPDLTREVFMMHRFDDLPYRRIAVRVGIGIDEVEAHMATAIKLLGRAARGESV
ncbi:RNA polymerase sigma factor [Novosphingobium naphthalenivorans]|uniref:RNA polymerase sigma factor n=1 Tax=Novosphingobium naphthalenivorans TaxID=273168 RepID=UPI0009FEBC89|nr:sigma-70 region 4 domain-containing protein [Novosphingobium naphthalenivorans]